MTSPDRDDDEVFKQIVAGFGEVPEGETSRWPVAENVAPDPEEALPGWLEPEALPEEDRYADEEHFVPPPAPRLPRPRLRTVGATAMVLLGLVVLFAPRLVGLGGSSTDLLLGLLLAGGGTGLLISWMRDAPPDDLDDGAVV